MAIALSTAGILVKYCTETTAGTRPTTGYTTIPDVKSIPEFGSDVNALQSTPLSATANHTYIEGLKDSGGSIGLTVNLSDDFMTAWNNLISAYTTANSSSKATWFEYAIPGMAKSFYFPGKPIDLGFGGADVDEVLEDTANILPVGDFTWATAST